jgi:hypothetical protein
MNGRNRKASSAVLATVPTFFSAGPPAYQRLPMAGITAQSNDPPKPGEKP